jgi:hypothetical protein
VAILAFEQNARRGAGLIAGLIDGENDDGSGMMNQIAADADASGFLYVVGGDRENRAAVDRAGREQTDFRFLA